MNNHNNYFKIISLFLIGFLFSNYIFCQTSDKNNEKGNIVNIESLDSNDNLNINVGAEFDFTYGEVKVLTD